MNILLGVLEYKSFLYYPELAQIPKVNPVIQSPSYMIAINLRLPIILTDDRKFLGSF